MPITQIIYPPRSNTNNSSHSQSHQHSYSLEAPILELPDSIKSLKWIVIFQEVELGLF